MCDCQGVSTDFGIFGVRIDSQSCIGGLGESNYFRSHYVVKIREDRRRFLIFIFGVLYVIFNKFNPVLCKGMS